MSKNKIAALMTASFLCAWPGAALAEASRLQVILGGEAYDGPPKFSVSFDGQVLGEAAVEAAIDTATAGRFADAADKRPYVQSFEFEIPEALFKPAGEIRVRLTNEAFGGEGSNRDRNLYVAAIAVNGQAVTVSGLSTKGKDGDKPNEVLGEFLVLQDGNAEAVSTPPNGGWPMPEATIAAAVQEEATTPAVAEAPAKAPVAVMQIKAPAAVESIETASINQDPEGACTRDELYNVIGFNENSNDLTPKLMERLDQIAKDIGAQKCSLLVTGYSSTQGDYATNALFAVERAQNVLNYLRTKGISFVKASATGAGETTEFGDRPSQNRRVVIAVIP
jgi:outer membrane protein OmpA-like peptidoglycan-associated protein